MTDMPHDLPEIDGLAAPRWDGVATTWSHTEGVLAIRAPGRTDMFIDPGTGEATLNAPRLIGGAAGDVCLSARVTVGFAATYDAGVLLAWAAPDRWAKLCFERSPQGPPMVVSVVTRGRSDDANAFAVEGDAVWLRISRLGEAYAFHASTDGSSWQFVRYFELGPAEIGFEAQSPTGDGCTASFDRIGLVRASLADLRDGS